MISTLQELTQHHLVMLRRLRQGPLTEFELIREVAEHSGFTVEEAADHMAQWLEELRVDGLAWCGELQNAEGQRIMAAALTKSGRDLVQ